MAIDTCGAFVKSLTMNPDMDERKREGREAWGDELRATASLAWPLILSNLSQIAMQTTDVAMMGWLGADVLAAGALGANLYLFFLIFGIGLVVAVAPMLARELGANRFAVRELRRTVRQGLWTAALVSIPFWIALSQAEAIMLALGQDAALARHARPMYGRCNGASCRRSPSSCCAPSPSLSNGRGQPSMSRWPRSPSTPSRIGC